MFNKSILALAISVLTSGTAYAEQSNGKAFGWQQKVNHVINAEVETPTDQAGRSRYIVQLVDLPAALHASQLMQNKGSNALTIPSMRGAKATQKMSAALKTPTLTQYRAKINQHQATFKANARQALGRELSPSMSFNLAYNGMVVSLTEDEANKLLNQPQVMRVIKEVPTQLLTDNGPQHIGAPSIWNGSSTGLSAQGEGVIIGVLDTGVNTDNRAFAATGDDGYSVVNPLGSGNYLGDCQVNSNLCNDKLIGVYSYPFITDYYDDIRPATGEDYNGHGSHTASTAGGNILHNVDVLAPMLGEAVGDGTPIGTSFAQVSGVAPHANIISYQICDNGGCYPSLTVASVEQAIEDGVDVLNYSVGPSGGFQGDPWATAEQIAFLTARAAGIFVAQAAGNDGSGASTTGNNSPWSTIVGAATHERVWTHAVEGSSEFSGSFSPVDGHASLYLDTGGFVPQTNVIETPKEVVYAGDYTDQDGNNLRLCDVQVYPWDPVAEELNDKIVICDRGIVPLNEKVSNLPYSYRVRVAGVIIRSTASSEQSLVEVSYIRPTALISREDGDALMSWVRDAQAADDTPKLSIGAAVAKYTPDGADVMARFSSRGPYAAQPDVMVPHISAPGVDVFAAYADEQPFHESNPAPADFSLLSGTSMASPHVAGAAALLRQIHPEWTPAQIQSAMMLTANTNVTKNDDGAGPVEAGFFDTGSGSLRVDLAAKTGLIMDVPVDDYKSVSPYADGDYPRLNMPYLSNSRCAGTCTWERTFTATQDGSWSAATEGSINGVSTSISPANFDIKAGESITLKVTANIAQRVSEDWSFLRLALTPAGDSPELSLPIAIKPMIADIPSALDQNYFWSQGSTIMPGLRFRYPEFAVINASPLKKATSYELNVTADSDNTSPFDDINDGTALMHLNVPEDSTDLQVIVGESSAADVDVFIGLDSNGDGIPQVVEINQVCATPANVGESCQFNAGSGNYWVLLHNYEGSGLATDTVRLDVIKGADAVSHDATASLAETHLEPYQNASLDLNWAGDIDSGVYYGSVEVFDRTSFSTTRVLGTTQVKISRTEPTAIVDVQQSELAHMQAGEMTFMLPGNPTTEDLTYQLDLQMDDNLMLASAVSSDDAAISHTASSFEVTLPAGSAGASVQTQIAQAAALTGEFPVVWSLNSDKQGFTEQSGTVMLANSNHAPQLSPQTSVEADMNSELVLPFNASDVDGDNLIYSMVQTSGPAVTFTISDDGQAILQLPEVDQPRSASFTMTVSDGDMSQSSEVTINIREAQSSGGSLGFGLGLLALLGLRRKLQS